MGRPTVAEVDLDALTHNVQQIRRHLKEKVEILAVVKADAYGHGAEAVAKELTLAGVSLFGVACVEEGIALRRSGVALPILVLSGIYPGDLQEILRNRLTPVLYAWETARAFIEEAKKFPQQVTVHVKVDTGMNRLGFSWRNWGAVVEFLLSQEKLWVQGLLSHLAVSESEDPEDRAFTEEQIRRFKTCVHQARSAGMEPRYVHLANSAATARWEEAQFNLVRPGLILYGVDPGPAREKGIALRPALSWKTAVLSVKQVPAGDSVSYGRLYSLKRDSLIATLPVGYADGYRRRLSNRGEVLIHGQRARVAGAVCMDLTLVDVTAIPGVQPGDEVVLLGRQGTEEISAAEMAGWAETIPYEVLCTIGKRVPRLHLRRKDKK
jgi:alanine racemase